MQRPRFRLLLRTKGQEKDNEERRDPVSARSSSAYRRRTLVLEGLTRETLGLDKSSGLVKTSKLLRAHTGLPKGIKFTPMSSAGRHFFVPYFQHQMLRSLRTLQRHSPRTPPPPLLGHQSPLLRRVLRETPQSSLTPRPLSQGPY